jgi:hypothetical protein
LIQGGGIDQPEGSKKKKKKKNEQYVDLGAGYDDNDSFIDNTDAVSFLKKLRSIVKFYFSIFP